MMRSIGDKDTVIVITWARKRKKSDGGVTSTFLKGREIFTQPE